MPLAVPAGNQSWEIKTTLLTTERETEAVQWEIKQRCLITSFRPSVVLLGDPLTTYIPNILEHVEVSLVLDQDTLLTQETNQAGGTPVRGAYVTLGSIGPESRLWNLKCMSPTPTVKAQFRTKIGASGSSGFASALIISVTAIGWYLDANGNPVRAMGSLL